MPYPRSRSAGGTAHTPGWKSDPATTFPQRYHNGRGFTPYVGIPERVMWDLGYSGRLPRGAEGDGICAVTLADAYGQITLIEHSLTLSWHGRNGGQVSAAISCGMLETYVLRYATPSHIELCVGASEFPCADRPDGIPSHPGIINVSMIFDRAHESVLHDLREFIERNYQRQLTEPRRQPAAPPQHAVANNPPGEERYLEHSLSPEPEARAVPSPSAEAGVRDQDHPGADRHARPPTLTLTLSAETVPDAEDWISFAGPSTYTLLQGSGSFDAGSERPSIQCSSPAAPDGGEVHD
jgi:hypothetical protein